jgi:adenylate cyclase
MTASGASTSRSDRRLEGAITALVRQEFEAPIAIVIGLAETLIEEARRGHNADLTSDLGRIKNAALLLKKQLDDLLILAAQTSVEDADGLAAFQSRLRHDLRTPLNAIKGYGELIMEEANDADREDLLTEVGKLLAAADHLLGQVDKLIGLTDVAVFEAPEKPAPAAMPARETVDEIVSAMASLAPSQRRDQQPSSRILVVDDVEANRELLARRLGRDGHAVTKADGGRAALEALAGADFDLVLLDVMMPEMDGYEVLTRLKSDPAVRHLPVIMISALDEIDSIVRCIQAGAEDYLPKPFDPVLLNARIGASLERKRLRDREQAFTLQLQAEKSKSDALLLNILPATVVERMRQGEVAIADRFPETTILFSDLVGFTSLAGRSSPSQIIELLNQLFSAFDALATRFGLEKIKTIGDSYMVAGGLPEAQANHALAVADMALGMIKAVHDIGTKFGEPLEARIGIHSGDVVAGVIGQHRFIYDVWGDTVNTASRLESSGLPNRIQISEATCALVQETFHCEPRGEIAIRGKGTMQTYFLGPRIR